jgi:hypothetical protein
VVESEPGVAIVVAVWMLDPVACSANEFGTLEVHETDTCGQPLHLG